MNFPFEYFTRFDLFAEGLIGFFALFLFFYAFTYTSVRGKFDKPHEKTLELLLPPIGIGFLLNWIGINSLIVGFAVIITYLIFAKGYLKLKIDEWIVTSITLFILLTIFGFLDIILRNILFIGFLIYNIIVSEKEIRDKKKKSK